MSADHLHCHQKEKSATSLVPTSEPNLEAVRELYEIESGNEIQIVAEKPATTSDRHSTTSHEAPLTELKVCLFEECHRNRKTESPCDPLKTRFLYILLGLLAVWIPVYALLTHYRVL